MRIGPGPAAVAVCLVLPACAPRADLQPETRPIGESLFAAGEMARAQEHPDFRRHVKPILEERCIHCHSGGGMAGMLDLSTRASAFRDPRIIVPGKASASALIVALTTGNHALSMPAVGTAPPPGEIRVLEAWIDQGAHWPAGVRLGKAD
jgi:cytochrome c5